VVSEVRGRIVRIRLVTVFCGATLLLGLVTCSAKSSKPSGVLAEPYGPAEGSVAFDLRPIDNKSGRRQWSATYSSMGKTAKFRIEIDPSHAGDAEDKALHVSFGKGRFLPEPGSDASALLVDLKRALEAKAIPSKIDRVDALPFESAILGENQSRSPDGGFSSKPSGDWIAMKIFLAKGEGEVFLNLNPVANKGEFCIKDPDYGDIVLAELAKVL
jgi:hypothetical protein